MLRIRIFAAAAALCLTALLSYSAAAQTTVGKPLVLLAGLKPPHETRTSVHAKAAHKTHRKLAARKSKARLAARADQEIAAQPAEPQTPPAALPDNTGLADSAPRADSAAPAAAAQTENPNQVVVAGQTVQIAAPDQVNALDLAADNTGDGAANQALDADPATPALPPDSADAAAPPQAVLAAPLHEEAGANTAPVGNASWIAQVLAALGGAVAAGAVAWFLIGSGPVRTYG